jgi:hypothetical protein
MARSFERVLTLNPAAGTGTFFSLCARRKSGYKAPDPPTLPRLLQLIR